jgi:U3 small nucleolar RNA-associated protein 12
LTCRLAALIIRLHYVQLGATTAARGILLKIRPALRQRAAEFRDIVGFNVAGIGAWEAHIKDGDFGGQIPMEDDEGNEDANTRILEAEDEVETGEMNQVGPGWG